MENTCFWKRKNVMKRSNCINCAGYDKFCTNYAPTSYRERLRGIENQQANEKQESEKPINQANSAEAEKKVIIAEEQPVKKKWYQIF